MISPVICCLIEKLSIVTNRILRSILSKFAYVNRTRLMDTSKIVLRRGIIDMHITPWVARWCVAVRHVVAYRQKGMMGMRNDDVRTSPSPGSDNRITGKLFRSLTKSPSTNHTPRRRTSFISILKPRVWPIWPHMSLQIALELGDLHTLLYLSCSASRPYLGQFRSLYREPDFIYQVIGPYSSDPLYPPELLS